MVFFSKSVFGTVSGCYNSQYKGKFAFNALFFCNAFLNYNNIKEVLGATIANRTKLLQSVPVTAALSTNVCKMTHHCIVTKNYHITEH